MLNSKITHQDLVASQMLIPTPFRGFQATPKFVQIAQRAESKVVAQLPESDFKDLAQKKVNDKSYILSAVIKDLIVADLEEEIKPITNKSRGGGYSITVPAYLSVESFNKKTQKTNFSNKIVRKVTSAINSFNTKNKKDAIKNDGVRLYPKVENLDSNLLYGMIDAFIMDINARVKDLSVEKKMKDYNFVEVIEINDLTRIGKTSSGKAYTIVGDSITAIG